MKRMLFLAFAACSAMPPPAALPAQPADLARSFQNPPPASRPWVYWFWINGNITKEGITADLEAMARTGIGGALIMHVGAGIPPGNVKFFSSEWRGLFKHAVIEADRLGIEITMNACDGWTGTGGPWIRPEEAMMKLVWTEARIASPAANAIVLSQPESPLGCYRDIAVLAFPTPPAALSDTPRPKISSSDPKARTKNLADGDLKTASAVEPTEGFPWIQFEFAEPFTARCIRFTGTSAKSLPANAKIHASDDGRIFRAVAEATFGWHANVPSTTIAFDEVTSRFFRVILPPTRSVFAELDLLGEGRINYWEPKAGFARRWGHGGCPEFFAARQAPGQPDPAVAVRDPGWARKDARLSIDRSRVLDISARMDPAGRLDWKPPGGDWIVLRLGYAPTGEKNGPASAEGVGLEPDALSPSGVDAAFSRFMGKLVDDAGPLAGKTLRYCHIDSWETGEQNWTANFPAEFRSRRGYDPVPLLPVMAGGRIVGDMETSERFLWDVRRTIADLLAENYYRQMHKACHGRALGFQAEASGAQQFLYDPITFQRESDLPMGEFWLGADGPRVDCKVAASVTHIFDKPIAGAEAFTSGPAHARWQEHPFSLKALGDEAFCMGINRFVFHRYAMQPWLDVRPGMTMGPWGIHFERTCTWWEQGSAWLRYLARCQFLLQQGRFAADVLHFTGEGAPNSLGKRAELTPPLPEGYDYDGCNAETLFKFAVVSEGALRLANGMTYRVLLLPKDNAMTPKLAARIRDLVRDGATVIGPKPARSPSLENFPACDDEVRSIAEEVWGTCDGKAAHTNNCGKGRVIWGRSFGGIFADLGLPPDFESTAVPALRFIHRRDGDTDFYFIANPVPQTVTAVCTFRVSRRAPELWYPDTGGIVRPALFDENEGRVRLPIRFDPCGSVFVVFRSPAPASPIVAATHEGRTVFPPVRPPSEPAEPAPDPPGIAGDFPIALRVTPSGAIPLPARSDSGITKTPGQKFAVSSEQGEIAYGAGHASAGISVGTNGICVFEHSARYLPARIVHAAALQGPTDVALVYRANQPFLYLAGKPAASAPKSRFIVHPGRLQATTPSSFPGRIDHSQILPRALADADVTRLTAATGPDSAQAPDVRFEFAPDGRFIATSASPGRYEIRTADGRSSVIEIPKPPAPIPLPGPWEITFDPKRGGPDKVVVFSRLEDWSKRPEAAIRFYSGTATYRTTFTLPEERQSRDINPPAVLDLGDVQVIAEVILNGRELGILWKPPFRVDAADALRPGVNALEIRVTNLWPNRLIGDEQLPDDCQWGPPAQRSGRALHEWPEWLAKDRPRASGRRTFATWKHWNKDDRLLPSGLLGPVALRSPQ